MLRHFILLAVIGCLVQPIVARLIVDLTHTLDEKATKWPLSTFTSKNFTYYKLTRLINGYIPGADGLWGALGTVEFYEHIGTHIDAPIHTGGEGRQAVHEIPPEKLIGPGVVLDVRDKAKENPDYAVTVDDVLEYERNHGRIPRSSIVMMNSGWAVKYPNAKWVFGTDDVSNGSSFHFPGFSLDACKMLLKERQVSVVGVDTPSTDPGHTSHFDCHRHLQSNEVPLLEYVANLDSIPPNGTTIYIGAIKHRGGTGGPVRIYAILDDEAVPSDGTVLRQSVFLMMLGIMLYAVVYMA